MFLSKFDSSIGMYDMIDRPAAAKGDWSIYCFTTAAELYIIINTVICNIV